MAISITVRREQPIPTGDEPQGYYLKLSVTQATDMPEEIFVFQHSPEYGEDIEDMFVNVGSPNDLAETPVGVPVDDNNPYFRGKELILCFRSAVELEECWEYIKDDITGLVAALKSLETLEEIEEVTF